MQIRFRLLGAPLFGLFALAFASACLVPPFEIPKGQLGDAVVPTHYELQLQIDPAQERFSGSVRIALDVRTPLDVLWLHSEGLEIFRAEVTDAEGRSSDASIQDFPDTGVVGLRLERELGVGAAHVELEWEAAFGSGLRGLYRVEVGDDDYAFTQFEAISARTVFPGFDEPAFKVPFDVSVVAPSEIVVLGNTPEVAAEEVADSGGAARVRHTFATTRPMPTYLLAWAVGPLDVIDAPDIPPNEVRSRALPLRGVAPRGRGVELAYALERTGGILEAVERYVGSEYPFAKLDIVSVPDFAAGAMENVGLVTFRDWLLLIDPETATEDQRRAFASVMAHELAHMWFGNLVTMPWWNDIWLNESFATWMAARITQGLYPEYRSDVYALRGTYRAMAGDALASARRIREPIASTHDIRNAFDGITYQKGGAVLGMVEAAVGEEEFRAAIQTYLARHRFGLATAGDFLEVVSSELGSEWSDAFTSFLDQAGLPFVEVTTSCNDSGRTISVEQSRYRPLGSSLGESDSIWKIPFCWRGDALSRECRMLEGRRSELDAGPCGAFVHPNAGGRGYYRWSLDVAALTELREFGFESLTVRERMSLADAMKAAFATGALDASAVFEAIEPLAYGRERYVAASVFGLISFAKKRLAEDEAGRNRVMNWGREIYAARARALGFEASDDDDGERRLAREQFVRFATLVLHDPELRVEAGERGRRYLLGRPGVPDDAAAAAELLGLVTRVAVRDGGVQEFEAALAHLFASEDASVRRRMMTAIGFADDPVLAERARELMFDERLRENERLHVLGLQAQRRETREEAWQWIQRRFDEIVERITPQRGAALFGGLGGFCDEVDAQRVAVFFEDRVQELEGGPRRLASTIEKIRICAAKVERHRADANAFFASRAAATEVR
ncbi:MAG: M1 family metallopeptidase [Myxococcota bacterium]|nr:M1 family metallopeptidase [Myxococcota bacterium]